MACKGKEVFCTGLCFAAVKKNLHQPNHALVFQFDTGNFGLAQDHRTAESLKEVTFNPDHKGSSRRVHFLEQEVAVLCDTA